MNIAKLWKKAFGVEFEIDDKVLEDFYNWNEPQWQELKATQGYCFINYIMITKELSLMLPKILYAKAIEQEMGLKPVILDWGSNARLEKLYKSYGIRSINVHKRMILNLPGIIKSLYLAKSYRHKSGLDLQRLEIDGVCVGKNIYGDILRSSSLSTIRQVEAGVCTRKIFTLSLFADTVYKILKKMPPKVCISDDWAYNEGIVLEYMNQQGAYITQINLRRENILTTGRGVFERYRHSEMRTQIADYMASHPQIDDSVVDAYLQKRFTGANCSFRDKVAFEGKKQLSRQEWNQSMGLNPDKKNIVIMCHTFSDAVFNSEYTAFRDYYDWTEQTLQLIAKLGHVNWIVKPHPARARYNESIDSFEKMFEKYRTDNMYVFPDDVSTASLKDVADVLVTLCGTSGMEFPCFGIPVIACGKAMYTDLGFTQTPQTLTEYESMLQNIDHIDKLSKQQIQQARSALYAYIQCFDVPLDAWDDMLYTKLHTMENKDILPENEKKEMQAYNSDVLQTIKEFVKTHPWNEAQYYKRGRKVKDRIARLK